MGTSQVIPTVDGARTLLVQSHESVQERASKYSAIQRNICKGQKVTMGLLWITQLIPRDLLMRSSCNL